MGRRSGRGAVTALMDRVARDHVQWYNGKLRVTPGTWRFVGAKYGKIREDGFKPTDKCHTTGRDMELVMCKGVFCPNPEMNGAYPMITNPPKAPAWHVPDTVCRNCQHRGKKGEGRVPYPHCKWAKEQRGGTAGATKSLLNTVAAAAEDTDKLLGQ